MSFTFNGIGTILSGERKLSEEEIKKWKKHLPHDSNLTLDKYRIATLSFVIFFLPLIPLKTVVYYYIETGVFGSLKYRIVYHPSENEGVYLPHLISQPIFYILPLLILFIVLCGILSTFMTHTVATIFSGGIIACLIVAALFLRNKIEFLFF